MLLKRHSPLPGPLIPHPISTPSWRSSLLRRTAAAAVDSAAWRVESGDGPSRPPTQGLAGVVAAGKRLPAGSWHQADMTPPLPDDVRVSRARCACSHLVLGASLAAPHVFGFRCGPFSERLSCARFGPTLLLFRLLRGRLVSTVLSETVVAMSSSYGFERLPGFPRVHLQALITPPGDT